LLRPYKAPEKTAPAAEKSRSRSCGVKDYGNVDFSFCIAAFKTLKKRFPTVNEMTESGTKNTVWPRLKKETRSGQDASFRTRKIREFLH